MNINHPPIRRVKIQCLVKQEKQGKREHENATECSHDFVKNYLNISNYYRVQYTFKTYVLHYLQLSNYLIIRYLKLNENKFNK